MPITHQRALHELAEAEQAFGWLAACESAGRFLCVTDELVDRLTAALGGAGRGPVVEVGAGSGELAAALRRRGCPVIATDANPPAGADVERLDAAEALARYRPAVVLGCFVPAGSGVDRAVLNDPCVQDYFVLGARLGGTFGDAQLWNCPGWNVEPLDDVARWLVTRHDVWLDPERAPIRHGEAWHLHRVARAVDLAPTTMTGSGTGTSSGTGVSPVAGEQRAVAHLGPTGETPVPRRRWPGYHRCPEVEG